ncbi:hypothetical protein GCM10022399_12800 [Terrabacter ginsenosidimutans]|uniref:Uncharacterized protein n=1 Tax=Terrabacter ginsenosidimutans TaxID=490575 RepID=A0ABP7CX94_9MICO
MKARNRPSMDSCSFIAPTLLGSLRDDGIQRRSLRARVPPRDHGSDPAGGLHIGVRNCLCGPRPGPRIGALVGVIHD